MGEQHSNFRRIPGARRFSDGRFRGGFLPLPVSNGNIDFLFGPSDRDGASNAAARGVWENVIDSQSVRFILDRYFDGYNVAAANRRITFLDNAYLDDLRLRSQRGLVRLSWT